MSVLQQMYSLIDKGRVMQMPFNGLSLLDYAINTKGLVISNIAVKNLTRPAHHLQDKSAMMLPGSLKQQIR